MKYRDSQLDIKLRGWFSNSLDQQLLRGIQLSYGSFRSLTPFNLDIDYPLLAIAGRNGAGKSTLLAIAACAFHNDKKSDATKFLNKKKPYYTFADFFIQSSDEIPPEGIGINYTIAHNNWAKSPRVPTGKGIAYQARQKNSGGKWNRYDRRVDREVIFIGIERIVPHSEKSQSKSYSRKFSDDVGYDWEGSVKNIVGYVIGKSYDEFKYVYHSKYRLPLVKINGKVISGFNMGAGENALFEIFSILHICEEGTLIVIDEIELGLHVEAQIKFVNELKKISSSRKVQIIFTTHSDIIFSYIPGDARVFIESINNKTVIQKNISSEYAFSKLSSDNSEELDILVEDAVAEKLLYSVLPSDIRSRIKIEAVGSATTLARLLGAVYQRKSRRNTLVIFDGDQKKLLSNNIKCAKLMVENSTEEFENWFNENVIYLPGDEWPEKWIVSKSLEHVEPLSKLVQANQNNLTDILKRALEAEKHKEFYEMSTPLGLNEKDILDRCCLNLSINSPSCFSEIINKIQQKLDT
ncbi:AAA family ATPase [Pectobacterium sp. PL64]|uniref:ATP-dependent nuclease n=1 Tax=Pectobacterium sp. PL64 TaxID=2738983 RepID=UPI001F0CC79C|nr:AAA family ATPase [Pectobacterium sp. PL64]UMO86122.1 AAA family ATPase [Pectobacterium sp. PL64]